MSYITLTPLAIRNNETFQAVLTFIDENNNLVNFSGFTAKMHIRSSTDNSLLYELSTVDGSLSFGTNPTTTDKGKIYLTIPEADAELWTWTVGKYDIQVLSGTGVYTVVAGGDVKIIDGVTTAAS